MKSRNKLSANPGTSSSVNALFFITETSWSTYPLNINIPSHDIARWYTSDLKNNPIMPINIKAISPANKVPPKKEKSLFDFAEYNAMPPNIAVVIPTEMSTISEPMLEI